MKKQQLVNDYLSFQKKAFTPFHVVSEINERLAVKKIKNLRMNETWDLKANNTYSVTHASGKSLISFHIPEKLPSTPAFSIVGSHTDSPHFRLKLSPWNQDQNILYLAPQYHGGMIYRSWLDRPLSLAGKVFSLVRKNQKIVFDNKSGLPQYKEYLVQTSKPIGVIPDLAIHLDREKNKLGNLNPETHMPVVISSYLNEKLGKEKLQDIFGVKEPIDGFELCLASHVEPTLCGLDDEFILAPRHDDLAMVYTSLMAFIEVNKKKQSKISVVCFFDAEETGSITSGGAESAFFQQVLQRVMHVFPNQSISHIDPYKSLIISADMAHAYHPGYADRFDRNHRPLINKGMVIKENANDNYATTGRGSTLVRGLCEAAKVPLQNFVIRQDLACGSTIGPMLAKNLSCEVVDIGAPMWSMHSSCETMGQDDLYSAFCLFNSFLEL